MTEKLCLKWPYFQDNISTAFGILRSECDFSNVTLACEDGQQVEAHKVILAASRPFFHKLLKMNRHPHPLIYMRGVKSEDLVAIIDFLYFGRATVCQESIEAFLALAEELNLKGLAGSGEDQEQLEDNIYKKTETVTKISRSKFEPNTFRNMYENKTYTGDLKYKQDITIASQNTTTLPVNITDIQELGEKVKSMTAKSQNTIQNGPNYFKKADVCTICGKEEVLSETILK